MFADFINKVRLLFHRNNKLHFFFYRNFGFLPGDESLYLRALSHKSYSRDVAIKNGLENERLEFLGDVVLDLIVADILYRRYPDRNEGFLTRMKSAIVCRKSLNRIAAILKIEDISYVQKGHRENLLGNILEAIIAAVYIDKGYDFCYDFVLKHILENNVKWESLEQEPISYKSELLEWAQKNKKEVSFAFSEYDGSEGLLYECRIDVDGIGVAVSSARTKREASQIASSVAITNLHI